MTYRQNDPSSKGNYSRPQARLNQQIRSDITDEGCPVIDESGTVCGETNSLSIFHEFRQMYDDCLKKLEGSERGNATLRKLVPFKKLIDDLWEQNTMLVETVEELEQEAACRVTNLQDRLNKCCQKICDYKDDVKSLVTIIQSFCENGVFDISGLKFKTFCSDFGSSDKRCNYQNSVINLELNGTIKAKEREVECLLSKLSEKDDLLKKYCTQVEELKRDLKNRCLKYQEVLKQLKGGHTEGSKVKDDKTDQDFYDSDDVGEMFNAVIRNAEDQIKSVLRELQNADYQIKTLAAEKKSFLKERNEIISQVQFLKSENEKLVKEITSQKKVIQEREELFKTIDALKSEKHELLSKVNSLHGNIQELSNNFKETRWALTSEVAEKHDQVQELKRSVGALEEQLRQADMQTQFKDDIIKELRKELKALRKSFSSLESPIKIPPGENSTTAQPKSPKPLTASAAQKKSGDDEMKLDIHIFPIKENKTVKTGRLSNFSHQSVEVQTEPCRSPPPASMRNVSTQHKTRVQKLPRSFGTLTVTPWSGASGEIMGDEINDGTLVEIKEVKKNLKGIYTERRGLYDVVNELRERKKECASNGKISKLPDMNKCQSGGTRSDAGSHSAAAERQERNDDNKTTNVNEKFISQIECLKKSLKMRVEEIKNQEEFMRDLEEELTRTKMDLTVLQEKYETQECHSQSGASTTPTGDFGKNFATLTCVVNRIEEMLRNLSVKQNCGLLNCKALLQEEMQKICSIRNDLEKGKAKVQLSPCNQNMPKENAENPEPCNDPNIKLLDGKSSDTCNLVHIEDVEIFKEKAVTGAVALERMKEQIDILENLIKSYIEEFPCFCDKPVIEECEQKLRQSRREFENVTYQLCKLLQKVTTPCTECDDNYSLNETAICKDEEPDNSQESLSAEEISRLKSECQRLQKQICDQGNESEKLRIMSQQLDEEIQEKRMQLVEHNKEMDSKMCEIYKLREIIQYVSRRLKQGQCTYDTQSESALLASPRTPRNMTNLAAFFCDLKELRTALEQAPATAFDMSDKLREENEKLKEKLECLERCVCNKEETLRVLQDTMKLRECQLEELKFRMQTSENHSCKLAQDVEEKCRLIANLQEAVRKCKQFEVNNELVESLRFEYCELECKLEKCEKEVSIASLEAWDKKYEVLLKDQKLGRLHEEVTDLSSKNLILNEKIKIMNPKFKIMYKTCHLFEQMVNGLQEELNSRECEIESLYAKIKDLEAELETEFRKCEEKADEDSRSLEELSSTIQSFQSELSCAKENYKLSIMETENRFKRELETRECELNNTICQLRAEISELKSQVIEYSKENLPGQFDFDNISHQEMYEKKISELKHTLECISVEHEEEKKNILQMLCEEKKENVKNKNMITTLNESIKRKILNEKTLEECVQRFKEDLENLKVENQQLTCEIETRKRIICGMGTDGVTNLTELEELICSLKFQKAELKAKYCNLKAEMNKEMKFKKMLECRLEELNVMLHNKNQEFNQLVENYKCASRRIQNTQASMMEIEKTLLCSQDVTPPGQGCEIIEEYNRLKNLSDAKTAENAKLFCEIQVLKVEIEKIQAENAAARSNKDAAISRLHYEVETLENDLQDFQMKCQKLNEENKNLNKQLDCWLNMNSTMESEFKEKQKDLSAKLRAAVCEKNDLLKSLVELQKQLEQMCLDAANKEKVMREMAGRKTQSETGEGQVKSKSEKIICNLTKEVKSLHYELVTLKEKYATLNDEYQTLLEEFKCCEKKKYNLEKLYMGVNNENRELAESKAQYERELNELKAQNLLLKDKITHKEGFKNLDEKMKLYEKNREITQKVKALENKVIPELEQEISEKVCCIENLKIELKEANLSSQRMRNEALKVVQQTRKYLGAQRFANDMLKARLECSNKRGNVLGIENRELEEQLKAVTRMNEFLLCQLENSKNVGEAEPRSFSPLPWGCSMVERDTSSSEYMAESGFQSMQPSPTNMDYQDTQCDSKRSSHWGSLKKGKCGGTVECPSHRNGVR